MSNDLRNEIAKELFLDAVHAKQDDLISTMAQTALTTADIFMEVLRKHDEKAAKEKIPHKSPNCPDFSRVTKGCPSCHGAGKYRRQGSNKATPCNICSGTGKITYPSREAQS